MLTHAAGRRSSSPVPARRESPGAVRSSFGAADRKPAEPPDYDTWLHNAEAFGHHFAALPAPVSQPVQRRRDEGESASPYALPAGLPMNALRTSFGPEPIQRVPEWLKKVGRGIGGVASGIGRGIGGLASGAWNLVTSPFRRGGGNRAAPPAQDEEPLLAPPRRRGGRGPRPPAPEIDRLPLLPPPLPAQEDNGIGLGPLPAPPRAEAPEIVPPSFEELQLQRARWEAQLRRGPRSAAAEESSSSSEDEGIDEDAVRAAARENSARLTGHGRQAHGAKGRARPASQVARNSERSRQRAEERTLAAAASREKKEKEKKKDK